MGGQNVINVTIPHLFPTQPQEGGGVPLISALGSTAVKSAIPCVPQVMSDIREETPLWVRRVGENRNTFDVGFVHVAVYSSGFI